MKRFKRTLALSMLLILALSTSVFAGYYTSGYTSGGTENVHQFVEGWCDIYGGGLWWTDGVNIQTTSSEDVYKVTASGYLWDTLGKRYTALPKSALNQVSTNADVDAGRYGYKTTGRHSLSGTAIGSWVGTTSDYF